jgi:phosphoribosylformylglycinamidine synthase
VLVEVGKSDAIMLQGMGRFYSRNVGVTWRGQTAIARTTIFWKKSPTTTLAPSDSSNPWGNVTEEYPWNPNGSPLGITALTSPNGQHLAMMPHLVDRCFRLEHWAWMPDRFKKGLKASPWIRMLQNARKWCLAKRVT